MNLKSEVNMLYCQIYKRQCKNKRQYSTLEGYKNKASYKRLLSSGGVIIFSINVALKARLKGEEKPRENDLATPRPRVRILWRVYIMISTTKFKHRNAI